MGGWLVPRLARDLRLKDSLALRVLGILPAYASYRRTYALLQRSQWWSQKDLETYQMRQLRLLLDHAYENVPYYRRVFDERGLRPEAIQGSGDLQLVPFLTRDTPQKHLPDLKARNLPEKFFESVNSECEESTHHYHIFPGYGIAELIGGNNRPISQPGKPGEAVSTNLTNVICPLIRYRTMAVAAMADKPCSCGRNTLSWSMWKGESRIPSSRKKAISSQASP
jgi:phenylacetate-coenzyme A ligase PaaK-like adenylate-forming protein